MKAKTSFSRAALLIFALFDLAYAQAQYQTIKQPNGATFQARERGEQWLQFWETPEGFVVRRGRDSRLD